MLFSERMHLEEVAPLSYAKRRRTFGFLVLVFLVSLPFLYLYATGYRYDWKRPTDIVSTGGMYIAVDRTGAEIYIDNELMRETRTFKKAFYAQSLDVGTHRVHVQKEGHHTWVKELPVTRHRVTEAEAFNLPLVPHVRVIAEWQSATGTMVVRAPILTASTTNEVIATTTKSTKHFTQNSEYVTLRAQFGTTSTTTKRETAVSQLRELIRGDATTTPEEAGGTTTVVHAGVKLYKEGEGVFATWVGSFEQMPYYYCAPDFPRYSTSTTSIVLDVDPAEESVVDEEDKTPAGEYVMHPVQSVLPDIVCDPTIEINTRGREVYTFAFLPGSSDFVILAQDDGVFMVEIDDRSWQNIQPLMLGSNLKLHIENGVVYVYDGTLIYQILYDL